MNSDEPPAVPPRTHPIHVRNRRIFCDLHFNSVNDDGDDNRSQRTSSIGFVEVSDLFKYENFNARRSICSSIRNMIHRQPSKCAAPESFINPMFSHNNYPSISHSLTHLPVSVKKRKSRLRRVLSCFSIISRHF